MSFLQQTLLNTKNRILLTLENERTNSSKINLHWKHHPIGIFYKTPSAIHFKLKCHNEKEVLLNVLKENHIWTKSTEIEPSFFERYAKCILIFYSAAQSY